MSREEAEALMVRESRGSGLMEGLHASWLVGPHQLIQTL